MRAGGDYLMSMFNPNLKGWGYICESRRHVTSLKAVFLRKNAFLAEFLLFSAEFRFI